ncbi:MAG: DNA polymerase/3'-5' exonuclease PolX [Phycisphaerae bacterium]
MTNADVARVFREVADMLEIKGEDAFRINSYRRVARTVGDLATDIADIAARGELGALPGVGKGSAAKIQELLDTGRLTLREELAQEVPESILKLLNIPGMGPKKVAALWRERGIDSLDSLTDAIEAGGLEGLKGFGKKSVEQIREGIDFLQRSAGRTRLGDAWSIAEAFRAAVAGMKGVTSVEHAGSLRRGRETVGDLDLLCVAGDGQRVIKAFTKLPGVTKVLAAGETKTSVLVAWGGGQEIQMDLRVVPEESFGAAWQYFTGSKEHNVRLRERAVKRGWSLSEYALTDTKTGRVVAARGEADIYRALDLPWFPPELREDRGEFELKAIPPDLLTLADIRGDLHMHTTASDGRNTIEEMAAAAKALGWKYVGIAEHSQSSTIANGLDSQRLRRHVKAVRNADAKVKGIKIWAGTEVDILADGSLDYDDVLLAELDFVTASIHSGLGKDLRTNTERTLAAIRNPYVNLIGHPTGRMINVREAMSLDMEAICKEAAKTGTALELNANYYRLDLKDQHARLARELGAVLCIACDAHAADQFDQMHYGVLTARRAGLRTKDVLNTWTVRQIEAFVKAKRRR